MYLKVQTLRNSMLSTEVNEMEVKSKQICMSFWLACNANSSFYITCGYCYLTDFDNLIRFQSISCCPQKPTVLRCPETHSEPLRESIVHY